jgi:hypothetical protein
VLPGDHVQVHEYRGATFDKCEQCGFSSVYHGSIKILEEWRVVCPRDWVIKGVKGEYYTCKPDVFAATYEEISKKGRRRSTPEISAAAGLADFER